MGNLDIMVLALHTGVSSGMDVADLRALEQALRIKECHPGCNVRILASAPDNPERIVLDGVCRGADGGWIVPDAVSLTVERIAKAVITAGIPDMLICGTLPQCCQPQALRALPEIEKAGCRIMTVADGIDECRPCNARLILRYRHWRPESLKMAGLAQDGAAPAAETFAVKENGRPDGTVLLNADKEGIDTLAGLLLSHRTERGECGLENAGMVFAGGYGLGSRQNFELLHRLASLLGAGVGATRAAVDAGFAERGCMIGQTGVSVCPALYVAFGISGRMQHISGMRDSALTVSVNTDSDAPISSISAYFMKGDAVQILNELIEQCGRALEK